MSRFLSIEIKNFKIFNSLKVKSFNKNINFIYGKNSVGKTSLLEAIFLLLCYSPNQRDPNLLSNSLHAILRYQFYRVINYSLYPSQESVFKSLWDAIFRNPEKSIELTAELENGSKLSLSISQGFNKDSSSREIVFKWNYTQNSNKKSQTLQYNVTEPNIDPIIIYTLCLRLRYLYHKGLLVNNLIFFICRQRFHLNQLQQMQSTVASLKLTRKKNLLIS